jgi:hypothetical protein
MFQAARERLSHCNVAVMLGATAAGLLLALCGAAAPAWGSSSCPNEALRTGPGANLPDCRAYELVSPPNKNGGQVDGGLVLESEPAPDQAAADGEAATYGAQTTFTEADPESSLNTTQYLSVRGADGWTTRAITPRQALPGGELDKGQGSVTWDLSQGFSENLKFGYLVAEDPPLVAGAPLDFYNPYLQDESDGGYALLSSVTPLVQSPGFADGGQGFVAEYAGMSADGSHVIFEANDALTPATADAPAAVPGKTNLYEWVEGRGLELVSMLPDGEAVAGGVHVQAAHELGFGGPTDENEQGVHSNYSRAISLDGTRVFWSGGGSYEEGIGAPEAGRQVYMHEITAGGARTVEVSASQKTNGSGPGGGDPHGPLPARYWTASADGSLVYFTSCQQLTNDSTAEFYEAGDGEQCMRESQHANSSFGQDLYQYNANTGVLSDLTVDHNAGETANVKGVIGASEDGSYVYFVATGKLAEGATVTPETANLYLWHDGTTTFIASLGTQDGNGTPEEPRAWDEGLIVRTSRVSPDGQFLAFESTRPLTAYDNAATMEVYEYDAATNKLVCASCNPTGLPPVGGSSIPRTIGRPSVTGWQSSTVQQRYLLDDGRLFFNSGDALLAQASDGQQNVYEYEPDALGSCHSAGGCIYLISSGTSSGPSQFMDASTDGSNVFFTTSQQLVAQDGDEVLDLYDARVDGGFSAAVSPPCGGEACRPPVTPAPAIYGAPTSATFVGAGNPPAVEPVTKKVAGGKAKAKKKKKKQKQRRGGRRSKASSVRAGRSGKGGRR